MKTMILCGGQGTRLREETEYRPKPLVDVGGRPILWHIMKTYSHYGFWDFVLCLGYRGNMIKEYFLNYQAMNSDFTMCLGHSGGIQYHGEDKEQTFKVTCTETGLETMTGGRVRRAARYLDGPFLLTYGDGLADVDVARLVEFHRGHGKLATVTAVRPQSRFGQLAVDRGGLVTDFAEKPRLDGWISAGYFVFEPEVLDYIRDDSTVLETEPLQQLVLANQIVAYRHEGFFHAMDTYREYLLLNEMWNNGHAPWKVWE